MVVTPHSIFLEVIDLSKIEIRFHENFEIKGFTKKDNYEEDNCESRKNRKGRED